MVEPGRLQRGAVLAWFRLGPAQFAVQGSTILRYVDLDVEPNCYCEDMEYRRATNNGVCKHVACAKMANGDVGLLTMYGLSQLRKAK